jgi:hypothetical protein
MNLKVDRGEDAIFGGWIYNLPNPEFLEIAMSRPSERDPSQSGAQRLWLPDHERFYDDRNYTPPKKLTEVRLLGDTSIYTHTALLLRGVMEFPNSKKLALAHFMLSFPAWPAFFADLTQTEALGVDLDVLWLLSPMEDASVSAGTSWTRLRHEQYTLGAAARDVRILQRSFPWYDEQITMGVGRGHLFEGFEVFEE